MRKGQQGCRMLFGFLALLCRVTDAQTVLCSEGNVYESYIPSNPSAGCACKEVRACHQSSSIFSLIVLCSPLHKRVWNLTAYAVFFFPFAELGLKRFHCLQFRVWKTG